MKKVLRITLAVATLIFSSIAFFACGKEEQHTWDGDSVAWNWDGVSSATATFKCKEDSSHTQTVNATISDSVTKDASCSEEGVKTYTATVTFEDVKYTDTKNDTIAKTDHSWDKETVSWTWDGVTKATATLTCKYNSSHTKQVEGTITSEVAVAPTCDAEGKRDYTAVLEVDGNTYKSVKSETIAQTGHNYNTSNITWAWNSDNTAATATFACNNDANHTHTIDATITSDKSNATCDVDGKLKYTASVTLDGKPYTDEKVITVAALGHDYDCENIAWEWNDVSKATATIVCKNDSKHVINLVASGDAIAKNVAIAATCEKDGRADYTATVTYDSVDYTNVKSETIAKLGHDYDTSNIAWVWNDDNTAATATFVCNNDAKHTQKVDATIKTATTDATCETNGKLEYTASVTFDGETYKNVKSKTLAALGHDYDFENIAWEWDDITKATATVICKNDAEHINHLYATGNDIEKEVIEEATCDDAGRTEYTATVTYDNKKYTNVKSEIVAQIGHNYDTSNIAWSWNDNYTTATATFACLNDSEHTHPVTAIIDTTTNNATCEEDGSTLHKATVTFDGKDYTNEKTLTLVATGHNYDFENIAWEWDKVSKATATVVCQNNAKHIKYFYATEDDIEETIETQATCETDGKAHYVATISYNNVSYNDTKENVVLPAIGHKYSGVWNWSDDKSTASITLTCQNNSEHVVTRDATVTFDKLDATCTTDGSITYSAAVRYDGIKYTDSKVTDLPKLNHNYDEEHPSWIWVGNSKATFVITCLNDSNHKLTYDATVTKQETPATCTQDGLGYYSATVEYKGNTYEDTKDSVVLPAKNHDYESTWIWNEDKTAATLNLVCHNDNTHTKSGDATITKTEVANTCTTDGYKASLATVVIDGETYTNTTDKTIIPKTGHDYDYENVSWTWEGTNKATAVVTCNNNRTHTQTYAGKINTTELTPTCTASGYVAYQATAQINGEAVKSPITGKVTVAATGHTLTQQTIAVATCTTRGAVKSTCSNCDYSKTEYSNVIDHTWNISSPTCTDAKICSVCKTSIAALGHDYQVESDTTVVTAATGTNGYDCEKGQSIIYKCSRCDDSYEQIVTPKKDHTIGEGGWSKSGDPVKVEGETCKYTQLYIAKCTVCGNTVSKTEEEENHNYTITVATAATCTTGGQKLYKCSDCDSYFYQEYEKVADAHDWVADKEGGSSYTCKYDSTHKKTVITSENNSAEVSKDELTASSEIALSNASITMDEATLAGLSGKNNIAVTADDNVDKSKINLSEDKMKQIADSKVYNLTLTADGETVSKFGEEAYVTVKVPYKLGDNEDPNNIGIWYLQDDGEVDYIEATYVVDSTGTYAVFKTNHFSYYTVTKLTATERCELYGHNDKITDVGFKVFDKDNYEKSIAEKCTKEAYILKVCQRCARTEKVVISAAHQHTYTADGIVETKKVTCTEAGITTMTCSICQDVTTVTTPAQGHDWAQDTNNSTAATCTEAGKNVYVCKNDATHTYTTVLPQKSHNYKKTVVAATCEAGGYTTYKCLYCDDTYRSDETTALGHDYVSNYVEHTQTEVGYTVYTCLNNSDHNYTKEDAAIGHVWNIEHATCVDDQECTICGIKGELKTGIHTRENGICTVCGVGCSGHEFDVVEEVEGDCTTDGYKKEECLICHYVKITTTTATGHSGKYICTKCGESLVGEDLFYNAYKSLVEQDLTIVIDDIDVAVTNSSTSSGEVVYETTTTSLNFIELALGFDENGELYATGYGEMTGDYSSLPFDQAQTFQAVITGGKIYIQYSNNSYNSSSDRYGGITAYAKTNEYILFADFDGLSSATNYKYYTYIVKVLEWAKADILPLIDGMAAISKTDINTMSLKLAETFLNLSVNSNGGYTITINWDGIQAINESLYTNDIATTVDLILGDGSYNAICNEIGNILAMPVGEIIVSLQEKGLKVSDVITAINNLISVLIDDDSTIQDLFDNMGITQMLDAILGTEDVRITDILSVDNDTTVMEYINIVMNAMQQNNNGGNQGVKDDQGADNGDANGSIGDSDAYGNKIDDGKYYDDKTNYTATTASTDDGEDGESGEEGEGTTVDTAAQIEQIVAMLKQFGTYKAYELIGGMTGANASTINSMVASVIESVSNQISISATLNNNGEFSAFNINVTGLTFPTGSTSSVEINGGVSIVANYVSDLDYDTFLTEVKTIADYVTFDRSFADMVYGSDGYIDAANFTAESDTTKPVIDFYKNGNIKTITTYHTETYNAGTRYDYEYNFDIETEIKYVYTRIIEYTITYYFPEVAPLSYMIDCGSLYELSVSAYRYEKIYTKTSEKCETYKNGVYIDEKENKITYYNDEIYSGAALYFMYNSATNSVEFNNNKTYSDGGKHSYLEDVKGEKVPESCTDWGTRYYVCIYCGDSYAEYYTTGHRHYTVTNTLLKEGGSCLDGVRRVKTCDDCGTVLEDTITYDSHIRVTHRTYLRNIAPENCQYDSTMYYFYSYECICGEVKGFFWNCFDQIGSQMTDGQSVETYQCYDACGVTMTRTSFTKPDESNPCKTTRYYTIAVYVNDKCVYTYQYEEVSSSHHYLEYGELVEGSTSCEDGIITYNKCIICGEKDTKSVTQYKHVQVVIFEKDLAEYGATCGEKLYIFGDLCGESGYDYYEIYDSEGISVYYNSRYAWESYNFNGEGVWGTGSIIYTCPVTKDCTLKLGFIQTKDPTNCKITLSVVSGCDNEGKGGTVIVSDIYFATNHNFEEVGREVLDETSCLYQIIYQCNNCQQIKTVERTEHKYESTSELIDSTQCLYKVTQTCKDCGDTNSWEETHHSWQYNTIKDATCTQYGYGYWYCDICKQVLSENTKWPNGHSYKYDSDESTYICLDCGLKNSKGSDGNVVLEDVTGIEGEGIDADDYVIGYYMGGSEDKLSSEYVPQISLILYKGTSNTDIDTVIVDSVSVVRVLEDVGNYVKFNYKEVMAWADNYFAKMGYSAEEYSYEVRLTFNPRYGNNYYDSAITFEGTHEVHKHEYETKYTLLGKSCEDGVKVQKICKLCDNAIDVETYYSHNIIETRTDISGYWPTTCKYYDETFKQTLYISYGKCVCGENEVGYYNYFPSCLDIQNNKNGYDENGNEWDFMDLTCRDDCGVTLRWYTTRTHDQDNYCNVTVTTTVSLLRNEEDGGDITIATSTTHDVQHEYVGYVVLNGDNTNCTQGVTVTEKCIRCGSELPTYTATEHVSGAVYELDLTQYGATCGEYFVLFVDPCGYNNPTERVYYKGQEHWSFGYDNYYDDDGNYINRSVYSCNNQGCQMNFAYNLTDNTCNVWFTLYVNYDRETHTGTLLVNKQIGTNHSVYLYSDKLTDETKCEYTKVYMCDRCDYTYSTTYIQHNYVSDSTCSQWGTGAYTCSRCNDTKYDINYARPQGHDFVDGKCVRCGMLSTNYQWGFVYLEDVTGKVSGEDITENDKVIGYFCAYGDKYEDFTPTIKVLLYDGYKYKETITVGSDVVTFTQFEMVSRYGHNCNDTFVKFDYNNVVKYIESLTSESGQYAGYKYQVMFVFDTPAESSMVAAYIKFTDGTYEPCTNHNREIVTYEFNDNGSEGNDCTSGVSIVYTCSLCGEIVDRTYVNYHYVPEENSQVDISEYIPENCTNNELLIRNHTCICGREVFVEIFGCQYESVKDGDVTVYEQYTCNDGCGLTFRLINSNERNENDYCEMLNIITCQVKVGEDWKTLFTVKQRVGYSHTTMFEYVWSAGGSCKDGVSVYSYCIICGKRINEFTTMYFEHMCMITNIIDLAEYGAACDEKIYIIAEPCNNTDGGSYYPSGIVIYSNQSNGGEFIVPEDYKYNVEYLIGTYSCQRCGITVKMYETIDIDHNAIFTIKYTLGEGEEITILNGVNCGHHYTPSTSA